MHAKRLEQRILLGAKRAIRDFGLIVPGDRVLVAISGGKDSYGLLWLLQTLQAQMPYRFDVVAFHLDQGQPGHDTRPIEGHLKSCGVPYEIEYQDTYTRVVEKTEEGKIYCALCSRFRRAILYKAATRHQCNKVALGHHREDLIETLLLNIFFSGQIKSMPPRLVADDGQHEVIRPLAYVPEVELVELARAHAFPVVPCRLCGSQDGQRKFIKGLLGELSGHSRHIRGNILQALTQVHLTHLLDGRHNPLYGNAGLTVCEPLHDDEECAPAAAAPRTLLRVLKG